MKFLLALFISYSCLSYGEDKSIPKAMIKDVDNILKQAPTLGLAPIGLCDSITPAADFVECSKAIELNEAIKKNFGKSEFDQLESLVRSCFQKRFEKCYPNLKKYIELEQVKNLFNEWKKDPRFRYPSGAGMCHYRAETLSYHLAELGYKTTTIRIEHSPTLIAMGLDSNDNLNGNYDDYQGFHTLVQIMVNENGKQTPFLLDPQYMTKPMPRDEYFIKTMGQVCEKVNSSLDLTNCYYKEKPQNTMTDDHDFFNPLKKNDKALLCGWSGAKVESRISIWPEPIDKSNKKIVNTNGMRTPEIFMEKEVSGDTSKQLIIHSYENYTESLKYELNNINSSHETFEEMLSDKELPEVMLKDLKEIRVRQEKRKVSIVLSLKKIEDKIRIVKKNLDTIDK